MLYAIEMGSRIYDGTDLPLLFGPDGQPLRSEYSDGMALPHILTFPSILSGGYQSYFHGQADEAVRKSKTLLALPMGRDDFIMGLVQERILGASSLPWDLECDNEREPYQIAVRDHVKKAIQNTRGLRYIVEWLLWSCYFGRYAAQIKWKWEGINGRKTLCVDNAHPVLGDKIVYLFSGVPAVLTSGTEDLPGGKYLTATNDGARALLLTPGAWRERFIIATADRLDADFWESDQADAIHGVGIRSAIAWQAWIRLGYLTKVAEWVDKIGLGVTLWYYELGNDASYRKVQREASQQSDKTNILIPVSREGATTNLGPKRMDVPTGGAELVLKLLEPIERHIERYIVGQDKSGGSGQSGSGLGNEADAAFKQDTKRNIIARDADRIAEALTGDLVNPGLVSMIQYYTFPETAPGRPGHFRLHWRFRLESVVMKEKVESAKTMVELGIPIRTDEVRTAAGFSKPAQQDEIVKPPAPPPGMGPDGQPLPAQPGAAPNGAPGQPPKNGQALPNGRPRPPFTRSAQHVDQESQRVRPEQYEQRHKPAGSPEGGQFTTGNGGATGTVTVKRPAKKASKKSEEAHPGTAFKSTVQVTTTTARAFHGKPVATKTKLTIPETGRVGEAIGIAYLKSLGFEDARPVDATKTNAAIDLVLDEQPTEIKAGLISNSSAAQRWRCAPSMSMSKEEKARYQKMNAKQKNQFVALRTKAVHARKAAAMQELEQELGRKLTPKTLTFIVNPDTQTADVYEFDGFHDRIGWNSPEAKAAYKGSVTYDHPE